MQKKIEARPLTPEIGAEIIGVDLSKGVDSNLFEQLHDALMEYQVIFLRDQDIDVDQQEELARRFGTPAHSSKLRYYDDDHPNVSLLENDGSKIAVGATWHADNTDFAAPPMGSLLYCEIAPSVGGDTIWSSMYAAYNALSEKTQKYIDGLMAFHDNSIVKRLYAGHDVLRNEGVDVKDGVLHPVVHEHPVTGKKALFVNPGYTSAIVGMSDIESQGLLRMLFEHSVRPEFQVRFKWQPGSLGIWDNRCTLHYALDDYSELRRMRRVQLDGEPPIAVRH